MSVGGVLWGVVLFLFDLRLASLPPTVYAILTVLNFLILHFFKTKKFARFAQVTISLSLPFLLQCCLGGFENSGAVMLWALLALIVSFGFLTPTSRLTAVIFYATLLAATTYWNTEFRTIIRPFPDYVRQILYMTNVLSISLGIGIIFSYYLRMSNDIKQALRQLEDEKATLISRLSKYLAPQIFQSIFKSKSEGGLSSSRKNLTVFFSDIKGFTAMTDTMESEAVTELLNEYFEEMSQIALKHGGTIDKFIGDAIMIFFGDPETRGAREDAIACVKMAIEMQVKMIELRRKWSSQGSQNALHVRVGINTGYCTVGNFGSKDKLDYTAIGAQVNLANRLESAAKVDQILISESTYAHVKETFPCIYMAKYKVKGFSEVVQAYQVVIDRPDYLQDFYLSRNVNGLKIVVDRRVADKAMIRKEFDRIIQDFEN